MSRRFSADFGYEDEELGPLLVHYEYEPGEPQTYWHPGCAPCAGVYLCQRDNEDLALLAELQVGPPSRHNPPWKVYAGDFCPVGAFCDMLDARALAHSEHFEEDEDPRDADLDDMYGN